MLRRAQIAFSATYDKGDYMRVFRDYKISKRECIFLVAVLLKLVVQMLGMSVIPNLIGTGAFQKISKLATYSSYALVLLSIYMDVKFTRKDIMSIAVIAAVTVVGSYFAGNKIMLLMLYVYGSKNIDLERMMSWICLVSGALFSFIVAGSKIGIIENWDFFTDTSRPRWGLGFSYPTHTSSALFIVVLLFCYVRKEKLRIWQIVLIEAVNWWMYLYTDSRAGAMLVALLPVVFYLLRFLKKPIRSSRLAWILELAFPVCAIVIIVMTVAYNQKGVLKLINDFLSDRLKYSQYSLQTYGVHLFGQHIEWVGWGGIGHTQTQLAGVYNFVDSSYLQLLLTEGIVVWSMIMLLWTASSFFAVASNNRYLAWALAFLALYCVVEQWLMNIGANPFLIFLSQPLFCSAQVRQRIFFHESGAL